MAEKTVNLGISKLEITALKEALFAQQELLQKLYNELDVEREAASSAASEALSMILRLQGDKAAIKMEANQYKRLAEEKISHNEEALAIFEDLIYQKEMEIASLEYQIQAYRYKLLSLGCTDIGFCETIFPENLLQRNETFVGDMGVERSLRRNSLPPIPFKFSYQKKGDVIRERSPSPSPSPSPDLISTDKENRNCEVSIHIPDVQKKSENPLAGGDMNLYWEEIKKLDERVKEISDYKGTRSKCFTLAPAKGCVAKSESIQIEHPQISSEIVRSTNPSSSSNMYDVFEVPRVQESQKGYEPPVKQRHEKANSISQVAYKIYGEDENASGSVNVISTKQREKSFSRGMESHSRFHQQRNGTSEIVEVERNRDNHRERRGEEELKLLKEIQEQLNSIQSEIRSMKVKERSPSDELPLLYLSEAMLHFWL